MKRKELLKMFIIVPVIIATGAQHVYAGDLNGEEWRIVENSESEIDKNVEKSLEEMIEEVVSEEVAQEEVAKEEATSEEEISEEEILEEIASDENPQEEEVDREIDASMIEASEVEEMHEDITEVEQEIFQMETDKEKKQKKPSKIKQEEKESSNLKRKTKKSKKEQEKKEEITEPKENEQKHLEDATVPDVGVPVTAVPDESVSSGSKVGDVSKGSEEKINNTPTKGSQPPLITLNNIPKVSSNRRSVIPQLTIAGNVSGDDVKIRVLDGNGKEIHTNSKLKQGKGGLQCLFSEIKEDGFYNISVKGVDDIGQATESKFAFTVNKSGTTFRYDKKRKDVRLERVFSPQIQMENLDTIMVLSCMINGKEVSYSIQSNTLSIDRSAVKLGNNKITLEVKDAAGNLSSMEPWEFYIVKTEQTDSIVSNQKVVNKSNGFWIGIIFKLFGLVSKSRI